MSTPLSSLRAPRIGLLVTVFAAALAIAACLLPAAASAASTPVALDVPNNGAAPLVQYDPVSKVTFIAWTDPQATTSGAIDLCVLPAGASACEGPGGASTGGPVLLTVTTAENPAIAGSNTISLGGITMLPNGDIVVIGTPVSNSSIAWESTGDGSAFLTSGQGLQNGGSFISPVSLFYTEGNVAPLGNTDIALLDDYGNYFADSPFAGPEYPAALPESNTNPPPAGQTSSDYPRKAQSTTGPEVAAEPLPAPAAAGSSIVVAVGDNYAGPNVQLSDCTNGDDVGTGYGTDAGLVGSSSAAGYLNAQNSSGDSIPAYSGLACNAENPVVASPEGGTQGIGVLENEGTGLDGVSGGTYTLDYRPFQINSSENGGTFGAPALVAKLTSSASNIDVVDDTTDGVYALFDTGGDYYVSYSADGGAVWGAPVEIPAPTLPVEINNPIITAIGGGAFELAYESNPSGSGTQTLIEAFTYQSLEQAPTTLSTIQTSGSTTGADITIPAGTVGEIDKATLAGTNAATATGTMDFALYDNSSCTGTPVFSGSASTVDGVASIADDASPGLAPGTYYWKAAYTGDTENEASVSTCGSEVLTVGPPATTSNTATSTPTSVSVTITCPAACTVIVTIEIGTGTASGARVGDAKKLVKLGTGHLTLKRGGSKKLTVKLTKAGKALIKKDHGKLKAGLALSVKTAHGTFKTIKTIQIRKGK